MIQCYAKRDFVPTFSYGCMPKLRYVSKVSAAYKYPRLMHGHDDVLEILFVHSGTGTYVVNSAKYPIQQGDAVICNSNVLHDEIPECNNGLSTYCCGISNLQLDGLKKNCLIPDNVRPVVSCHSQQQNISCLMDMLHCKLSSDQKDEEECCHFLMLSLLTILLKLIKANPIYIDKTKKDDNILRGEMIKAYIDAHYDEELSLSYISRAFNLNPYYLIRIFKKVVGYSPMQYITRRRIGEAQKLLVSTDYPVVEIAPMVGYNSISHFNMMFFKYIGISPRKYRNTYTIMKKKSNDCRTKK
ncbi:AraC family transcriptional regulator|uniref:AraC-type DNA-binding protein n=1 Tax=Dendrosporobacter quercicolus TaxID=146817 RepID=A0A1G9SSH3_9FIRM|nr:AraC family transcriptional regulator [Dendrosporobacter quercicolus]NSL48629.1 AraC family transcriptional regulator [Dendrosporobacter quercicolus DSM 1736]SDM38396.1 AraC-type DNA-binding protein [Dendrosporobacter quercicolus]